MGNGYSGTWVDSNYAGIKQKWLLVRSEQAGDRECGTLNKRYLKTGLDTLKDFKRLCRKAFSCEADASQALFQWQDKNPHIEISDSKINSTSKYHGRGRPAKSAESQRIYSISGCPYSSLATHATASAKNGLFILATNDSSETLSMQDILAHYKSQQSVEKGFRFLKSPDFLTSSIYLKNPQRVEALLMIMTCCLMIYAALEHMIRKNLKDKNLYFIDMKKKPHQCPTARWVFYCFQGIAELTVDKEKIFILNLQEWHRTILKCLGKLYQDIYS